MLPGIYLKILVKKYSFEVSENITKNFLLFSCVRLSLMLLMLFDFLTPESVLAESYQKSG